MSTYITRPKFLSGFEVEWIKSLGDQDPADFNPDLVQYAQRDFANRAEAVAFAEKLQADKERDDFDPDARMTAYHLETYDDGPDIWPSRAFYKEYDGETEYFTEG